MFAKLLKHEWRATKGVLALLCVIILISGTAVGLSMRHLMLEGQTVLVEIEDKSQIQEILCVLLTMAGIFAIGFCCLGGIFLFLSRFYKRCFTDEGYLTFTLPVTNHQILLSGILNTILGMAVILLTAVVGGGIILGLFLTAVPEQIIWADVWVSVKEVWQQILESLHKNAGNFLLVGVNGIINAFASLIELMLAITIGALIARKHKIIAAVAVYYGIDVVLGMVNVVLMSTTVFSRNISWLLGSTVLVSTMVAVGGYFLMHWLTSKKLNLT